MSRLRRVRREVYALYGEQEFLAGAAGEACLEPIGAISDGPSDSALRRRFAGAAVLLGALAALAGVLALSIATPPRRRGSRSDTRLLAAVTRSSPGPSRRLTGGERPRPRRRFATPRPALGARRGARAVPVAQQAQAPGVPVAVAQAPTADEVSATAGVEAARTARSAEIAPAPAQRQEFGFER